MLDLDSFRFFFLVCLWVKKCVGSYMLVFVLTQAEMGSVHLWFPVVMGLLLVLRRKQGSEDFETPYIEKKIIKKGIHQQGQGA